MDDVLVHAALRRLEVTLHVAGSVRGVSSAPSTAPEARAHA